MGCFTKIKLPESFNGDTEVQGPVLVNLPDGINWMVMQDFTYEADSGKKYTIDAGFIFDLASIPQVFKNILSPYGKYTAAAILHDYFYKTVPHQFPEPMTREEADNIFFEGMKSSGVDEVTCYIMYETVKGFGGSSWR